LNPRSLAYIQYKTTLKSVSSWVDLRDGTAEQCIFAIRRSSQIITTVCPVDASAVASVHCRCVTIPWIQKHLRKLLFIVIVCHKWIPVLRPFSSFSADYQLFSTSSPDTLDTFDWVLIIHIRPEDHRWCMSYNAAQYCMSYIFKGRWNSLYTVKQSISIFNYHAVTWVDRDHHHQYPWQYGGELSTCWFLLETIS